MNFDETLFNILFSAAHRGNLLDGLIVISAEYIGYIIAVIWLGLMVTRKGWKERIYICALTILSLILSWGIMTEGIKTLYPRPRPFIALPIDALIQHGGFDSFPSAHIAFFGVLALVIYGMKKSFGRWALLGIGLIAIGRVAAGVHWPSDVIAGGLIAFISFYLIKALLGHKGYKDKEIESVALEN